jgi:hypothetical protein
VSDSASHALPQLRSRFNDNAVKIRNTNHTAVHRVEYQDKICHHSCKECRAAQVTRCPDSAPVATAYHQKVEKQKQPALRAHSLFLFPLAHAIIVLTEEAKKEKKTLTV